MPVITSYSIHYTKLYDKKPIYDIPGFPSVLAGELIDNLMEQAAPFKPGFTLGEAAVSIDKIDENTFVVTTDKGTKHEAPIVMIAGGLGVFEPRKPPIDNITDFEDKGVEYIINVITSYSIHYTKLYDNGLFPDRRRQRVCHYKGQYAKRAFEREPGMH